MARFMCPGCNSMFEVATEHLGKVVRCPSCGEPLSTAASTAPAAPVAAPAAPPFPGGVGQGVQPAGLPGAPGPAAFGQAPFGQTRPTPFGPAPLGQTIPIAFGPGFVPPAKQPNPAGLLSFLICLAVWLAYCGVSGSFGVQFAREHRGADFNEMMQMAQQMAENRPPWLVASLIGLAGASLLGLILGVYAVTRPNRRKGLAIAGVVLGALGVCCLGPNVLVQIGKGMGN